MKKIISLILALATLLCGAALAGADTSLLGQPFPDFTVTTADGNTFTLSEVLESKKAVMINLWATWCPPCRMEFPFMQEAYEKYSDDVEIIALSREPKDTPEVIASFAEQTGLTFPMGSDTETNLGGMFSVTAIPTTFLVDRFGNLCLVSVGAMPSSACFERAFAILSSDDYTETAVMDEFPAVTAPTVDMESADMAKAAGIAEGSALRLTAADDPAAWPFDIAEGGDGIVSTNARAGQSSARIKVIAQAHEGDAFAFSLKVSSEDFFDYLSVEVNGEVLRRFSGETDWTEYAVPLSEGENDILFSYEKDEQADGGSDTASLKDFRILSGSEAEEALKAVPVFEYAGETALDLVSEGAKEIIFETDDEANFAAAFGAKPRFFIVNGIEAGFTAALSEGHMPDTACVTNSFSGETASLRDLAGEGFTTTVPTAEDDGAAYTFVTMVDYNTMDLLADAYMLFADEANAALIEADLKSFGFTGFTYLDGTPRGLTGGDTSDVEIITEADFTVTFVDQDGNPVPGCAVNFCTDEACTLAIGDENGVISFTGAPYAYHVQILSVPEGFSYDETQEFYTKENGDDLVITLTRK